MIWALPQFKSTWVLRGVSYWLRNHLPYQHTATERQNIIDKTHTWQQCSVTISEVILTTKYGFIQSQIDFTAKHRKQNKLADNNTSTLAGEKHAPHALNQSSQSPSWHTFEATHAGSRHTAPQHSVVWNHRGRGNSLNATSANFSARRTQHSLAESRHVTFAACLPPLKIAPGFPIHVGKLRHDKDKCTRF